uniref:Uncharacterized protein n=1 Tax=Romanomermis culicivorax TaxID=13658 RepID=A0A915JKH9_ROMCU
MIDAGMPFDRDALKRRQKSWEWRAENGTNFRRPSITSGARQTTQRHQIKQALMEILAHIDDEQTRTGAEFEDV